MDVILHSTGSRATLVFLGNEDADRAAKDGLLLPRVTLAIPRSTSQIKATAKRVLSKIPAQSLNEEAATGSRSASWYQITSQMPQIPDSLPRHTRTRLHRLRLGYHCLSELRDTLHTCSHCHTNTPLLHYLEYCQSTTPYLNRESGNGPYIIQHTDIDDLITMVNHFPPPR